MPIYEYNCDKCGRDFEELVFDDTPPVCPHCGSQETHKLMSRCAHSCGITGEVFGAGGGSSSSGGGCSGCSGGNCSSCGH